MMFTRRLMIFVMLVFAGSASVHADDEQLCLEAGLPISAAQELGITGTNWENVRPKAFELHCMRAFSARPDGEALQTAYARLHEKSGRLAVAEFLYGLAAANEYAPALFELGRMGVSLGDDEPLDLIFSAANANYPPAQYEMGLRYLNGDSVPKVASLGIVWISRAANADFFPAITELVGAYEEGVGVARDKKKLAAWRARAANLTVKETHQRKPLQFASRASFAALDTASPKPDAETKRQRNACLDAAAAPEFAARLELTGIHWNQLDDTALPLCEAAFEQTPDDDDLAYALGRIHHKAGRFSKAFALYTGPAKKSHAAASHNLGVLYLSGDGVQQNDKQAFDLVKRGAHAGYASSQFVLGNLFENGRGTRVDKSEAAEWYLRAAEKDNSFAQKHLAFLKFDGDGVRRNQAEAAKWFKAAAEDNEHADAQTMLGIMYTNGYGLKADPAKAVHWYERASKNGNATAQNNLGIALYNGKGVAKDYAAAAKWFRMAAEQESAPSQFMLGLMSYKGQGMARDRAAAKRWYKLAADQGHQQAIEEYDKILRGDTAGAVLKEIGPTLFEYWLNRE